MVITSEQFITGMKLRELRKQRESLLAAYNKMDQTLSLTESESERLPLLYSGLREIQFAGHALHPDVTNLEPILAGAIHEAENKPATGKEQGNVMVNAPGFWRLQLEKELECGRLRSEIVFIFAALLEEWTQLEKAGTDPEADQQRKELLTAVSDQGNATLPPDLEFLDALFEMSGLGLSGDKELLQKIISRRLYTRVEQHELGEVLRKISADQYHSTSSRRQAQQLMLDGLLIKEFADALSIIVNELDKWDWPVEGVTVRAAHTPNKWRLFLNEDLPTACLLEILGRRWLKSFEEYFAKIFARRWQELQKATAELSPETRLDKALELYRNSFGIKPTPYSELDIWTAPAPSKESDIWEDPAGIDQKTKNKTSLQELLRLWSDGNSITGKRAVLRENFRNLERLDGYARGASEKGLTEMELALAQINAEIQLGKAAFPGQPLYIMKADLKNYYPAVSHPLILEMLAGFGLSATQLQFFRRYLEVEVKEGKTEATLTLQVGIPNHRRLSDLLGELLLLLLDYYLKHTARVQSIRLIDDICLIATDPDEAIKAWQALEKFCVSLGLTINEEKSGAICIGGTLPPELPVTPPVWSMVTINNKGEWLVDQTRFQNFLEQTRHLVNKTPFVIARVEEYNNSLNYLVRSLALRVKLDESHRESAGQAMRHFQNDFFGTGQSMVEGLRQLIRERFLGNSSSTRVPDGWLHWPITAGGLSLYHPLVLGHSYERRFSQSKVNPANFGLEKRPLNWQRSHNSWFAFYQALLEEVAPAQPEQNQVMETLVEDFIERGSEISIGQQESLSAYWRWIVYLYGP